MKKKLFFHFMLTKQTYLAIFMVISSFVMSQEQQYGVALVDNGATSGNSRAPQGLQRYSRTVYLITAAEMTANGWVNGDVLTAIGFNYSSAQNVATTGNFIVYLENTADVTNNKSTTWATAITGMTTVSNSTFTIPAATGQANHVFTGGSPFTYTGAGVYVAFEYQNATGALATTGNFALCTTTLAAGLKSAQSTTVLPVTITASNWRPMTYFAKTVPCANLSNLVFSSYTNNSATITWTETANVDIEYGLMPYTQGSGGTSVSLSNVNTYTLSSLAEGKSYDVYTRKNCGGGVYSSWKKITVGTTSPTPVTTYPYNQNFEPGADQYYVFNLGWGNQPTGNTGTWGWFADDTDPATTDYAHTPRYFMGSLIGTSAQNAWFFSKPMTMTAGNTYNISYYYRTFSTAATTAAVSFSVGINTTNSGTGATNLVTHADYNNLAYVQGTAQFVPTTTGTYYVGFQNHTPARTGITTNNYIFVDTFSITEQLGVEDINANQTQLTIYPNPVKESFQVRISEEFNTAKTILTITDLSGKVVKTLPYSESYTVSDLAKGVYMLTISDGTQTESKKLIKE